MPLPPIPFPLRARHAGTGPVHAVRSITAGGHNTACLIWLDPAQAHQWLPAGSDITCTKCARYVNEK